jgi:hypothetical protein
MASPAADTASVIGEADAITGDILDAMLHLHFGWPRTGTTSLQAGLFEHRRDLAGAGVVYPERWMAAGNPTHHGLSELIGASRRSGRELDELVGFLEAHSGDDVLFSAEIVAAQLRSAKGHEDLLFFLAAVQEVTPTRCHWVLRRLDEGLVSLYLWQLAAGVPLPRPAAHFEEIEDFEPLFAGMRLVEEAVGGEAFYVEYRSDGAHARELLRGFGIPDDLAEAIYRELERRPRLNARLSHKQAAVLLNVEALAERLGSPVDERALRKAFRRGECRFDEDRPCELVDSQTRARVHERALAAAREQGFRPYLELFGDAAVAPSSPPSLGAEALTDGDLSRLAAALPAQPGRR